MKTEHCDDVKPHESHVVEHYVPNYSTNTCKVWNTYCPGHKK